MSIPDQLKPHYDSPLEWWYMHGNFVLKDKGEFYFMLTIFRNQFKTNNDIRKEGYQFILSVLGISNDENWQKTIIDPVFFNEVLNKQEVAEQARLDKYPITSYFSIVREEGPPDPIILSKSIPKVIDYPFSFTWDNIQFKTSGDNFSFKINDKEAGLDFSFECKTADGGDLLNLHREEPGGIDQYGMSYLAHPRLKLTGFFNKKKIGKGAAWIDHQWGTYNWLFDSKSRVRTRAWQWLGVNLNDGSDLIILNHRDARTGRKLSCFAVWIQEQNQRFFRTFEIESLTQWFSYNTDCYFPISAKIIIPELQADLEFTPFIENQEISVFSPMRSIWQGAGKINGSFMGQPVKGMARYELAGYSYIHIIENHFKRLSKRIDRSIEEFLPKRPNKVTLTKYLGESVWFNEPEATEEMLCKPVWDLMSRSGKRWRPILSYLLLKAFKIDPEPYEQLAFALSELLHTGSLIIDDIQDGSEKRRGSESIHLKYGLDQAIAAGNTLYYLPTLLIMDHPVLSLDQKRDVMGLLNQQLIQAHFGQSMDLYWSKQYSLNGRDPFADKKILDRFKQIYALKTGAPVQGMAEAAAVIANTAPDLRKECRNFANSLGIAFQTMDDIHNFSLSRKWGKITGEDLKEGKMTFVIAYCIKNLDKPERELIIDLIKSPISRSDDSLLQTGIELIRTSGLLDSCRELAVNIADEAWDKFSGLLQPTDSKIIIRALLDYLIKNSNYK